MVEPGVPFETAVQIVAKDMMPGLDQLEHRAGAEPMDALNQLPPP
jgi:hypothetical protein